MPGAPRLVSVNVWQPLSRLRTMIGSMGLVGEAGGAERSLSGGHDHCESGVARLRSRAIKRAHLDQDAVSSSRNHGEPEIHRKRGRGFI